MKAITAIVIGCLLLAETCFAHKDYIIAVNEDGTLEGIPSEYGPAAMHVEFAPQNSGSAPITSITLDLGKNRVRIPICVTGLLRTQRMGEIKATASWYHDETLIPYYLNIDFFDPGYNKLRWPNPGYSLLFDLHTGKLMEMDVHILRDSGRSVQQVPVDIRKRCKPEELRGFASDAR